MTKKELKKKYEEMLHTVEHARMYDGRNAGEDEYLCNKCGATVLTRYRDKGVTPFTMRCTNRYCNGIMIHEHTFPNGFGETKQMRVVDWVRPSFKQLEKMFEKDDIGAVNHVLQGGLVLEDKV